MDWGRPYSLRVRVTALTDAWGDGDTVSGVTACGIERSDGDMLESCSLTLVSGTPQPFAGWARIDALASQGGESVREPLGCFRLAVSSAKAENGAFEVDMEGDSVLAPLEGYEMGAGAYAPYGADAAVWCADLMRAAGVPSPIATDATAPLPANVVFGDSDTALEAVWAVLGECGLRTRLDGDGTVRICAEAAEPSLTIERGLMAAQLKDGEVEYTRPYTAGVRPGDLVRLKVPSLGLDGDMRVTAQSIDLEDGMAVSETAEGV